MSKLIPVEFNKQRIMTTKVLADVYGTEEKNIQTNYLRNHDRFIEGKHYIKLEGEQLKEFKESLPTNSREPLKFASQLFLWTEKGAARHAKILDTDEAWQVYEELEETYFRVKEDKIGQINELSPQLQLLINMELAQKQIKEQINQVNAQVVEAKAETAAVKEEVQSIREVVAISPSAWKNEVSNLLNKMAKQRGATAEAYREVREESYKLLDERAGAKLSIRLTNMKRKVLEETGSRSRADKVNKVDVISQDKRLTEVYIAIVKEMAIKYKVA